MKKLVCKLKGRHDFTPNSYVIVSNRRYQECNRCGQRFEVIIKSRSMGPTVILPPNFRA